MGSIRVLTAGEGGQLVGAALAGVENMISTSVDELGGNVEKQISQIVADTNPFKAGEKYYSPVTYYWPDFYKETDNDPGTVSQWARVLRMGNTLGCVILNRNSGDWAVFDQDFLTQGQMAKASGAKRVLFYVKTQYGAAGNPSEWGRDVPNAEKFTHEYILSQLAYCKQHYPDIFDGVFLDEFINGWGSQAERLEWYKTLVDAIREKYGKQFVIVGNCGSNCSEGVLGLDVDIFMSYESTAEKYLNEDPNAPIHPAHMAKEPGTRFWHVIHDVTEENYQAVFAKAEQLGVAHLYITDGKLVMGAGGQWVPEVNPYQNAPSDWITGLLLPWVKGILDTRLLVEAQGKKINDLDDKLSDKANTTYVDSELQKKASEEFVRSEVAKVSTGGDVDLSSYAKVDALNAKADKTYVDSGLAKKANASDVARFSNAVVGVEIEGGRLKLTHFSGAISYVDLSSVTPPPPVTPPVAPATKILPVTISTALQDNLATGGFLNGRTIRLKLNYGTNIPRWRVHVRNWNPRTGSSGDDIPTTITRVTTGDGSDAELSGGHEINASITVPGGSEWVSDWIDYPLEAGTDYVLEYTYTGGAGKKIYHLNTPAYVRSSATNIWPSGAGVFHWWLEAEVPSETRAYAFIGDSLTAGFGASLTAYESWPAQLARTQKVLPIIMAANGESMTGFMGDNKYPELYTTSELAKPDVVFQNMGSNDIFAGRGLERMQTLSGEMTSKIKTMFGDNTPIVTTAILPRNSRANGHEHEVNRRAYNAWLAGLPSEVGAIKHINIVPAVSSDDDSIPTDIASDGTHPNATGYAAIASLVNREFGPSEIIPASFNG